MKTFRFIGMALIAVFMCVNFTACSDDDDDLTPDGGSNIPTNTIHYQTTDEKILRLDNEDVFGGAEIISNTYSTTNGYGVLEFSSEVTAIEKRAFENEKTLLSITLPNSVASIEDEAFYGCSSLTSATIGNRVKNIGGYAFWRCLNLTSIEIPNSVTSIEDNTFAGCTSIASITIGNNVERIRTSAFANCWSLESITIPASVTDITSYAFSGCRGLTSIYVKRETPINTSYYVFSEQHYENATLYVPKGSLTAYKNAEDWKYFDNIVEY